MELQQQLLRLHGQGIKLAIASGRPAMAAAFLFERLPLRDAGLFCTGAELYEPKTGQHLQLNLLDANAWLPLYRALADLPIYCEFYSTERYFLSESSHAGLSADAIDDIAQIHSQHLRVVPEVFCMDKILEQAVPITKLLLGVNKTRHGDLLAPLAAAFPQLDFAFAHFLPRPDWLFASVVAPTANKPHAFKTLLEYHGVTADAVMAFGDSHSDQYFLQQAGMGVAMGNASAAVKAAAAMVTLSADHNGVAAALQYLA